MCASPFDFLRAGPPPPRVAVLPDAVFFSRSVPVPVGATRADVVAQVGVAMESLSPFPLAQLYYGYFWPAGSERALAYASYRRRFTVDQVSEWAGKEFVLPAFAGLLGAHVGPSTTVILSAPEGLTAIHWDQVGAPSAVLYEPLPPETTEETKALARARLLKAAGEAVTVLDAASPPVALPGGSDHELLFQAGDIQSWLEPAVAAAMDVRDKGDLEAMAKARRRDMLLWRVAIGSVLACILMALGEVALFGTGLWQKARISKVAAQKPTVSHIMDEQDLAGRIAELSTKRLLPLEMISAVSPETALPKNPPAIQFLRATVGALNTIQVEAQTNNAGEIAGYKTALEQEPGVDRVEIRDQRARDNVVTFTLIVTFKPGALTPAAS